MAVVLYKYKNLVAFGLLLLRKSFKREFYAQNFNDIEIIVNSLVFKNKLEYLIWVHKVIKNKHNKPNLIHHLVKLDVLISSDYDETIQSKLVLHYDDLIALLSENVYSLNLKSFLNQSMSLMMNILRFLRKRLLKYINRVRSDLTLFFEMSSFLETEMFLNENIVTLVDFKENLNSLFKIIIGFVEYHQKLCNYREFRKLTKRLPDDLDLVVVNLVLFNKLSSNSMNHPFLLQSLSIANKKLINTSSK